MTANALLVDLGRCIGCQACVVACKAGNELQEGEANIRVREVVRGTFPNLSGSFVHHRCYHCADAGCVAVCPTGALYKLDGLTAVDAARCSGCAYCVDACSYGVPKLVNGHVSKCTACLDVIQNGGVPYCVQTCPSEAIKFGTREAMLALAAQRVEEIRGQFPRAQVYGETQLGGLGTLMVLPDDPESLGLPAAPQVPQSVNIWQKGVQPLTQGFTALGLIATGLAFVFARRNHRLEMKAGHQAEAAAEKEAPHGDVR